MTNLNTIEKLRTRKEVEDYFKQIGKEITEEEIDALKQSYDQAQESSGALTMQQLDDVAGGFFIAKHEGRIIFFPNKIKFNPKYKVHMSSLAFGTDDKGNIDFIPPYHPRCYSREITNTDEKKAILENSKWLPVFYYDKNEIFCFPIDKNSVPQVLNISATQMGISAKECIKVYLEELNAQFFIDYSREHDDLTEYDLAQLTNLKGLVEAAKQPMPPAPVA